MSQSAKWRQGKTTPASRRKSARCWSGAALTEGLQFSKQGPSFSKQGSSLCPWFSN